MDSLLRGGGRALTSSLIYNGGVGMTVKNVADAILIELADMDEMDFVRVHEIPELEMIHIDVEDPSDEANECYSILAQKDYNSVDSISVIVSKPLTRPFVAEDYEFNSLALLRINRLYNELRELFEKHKLTNSVSMSYGIEFSMSISKYTTEDWMDDVGNMWKRERIYIDLKFTKTNMGHVEAREIARMVDSSMFWDIILSMLPVEVNEKLIEIDNLVDETYPNF